jgi:3-isopropylmalate dehydratase small subunit
LPVVVHREAVEAYKPGDNIDIHLDRGEIYIGEKTFNFTPLPDMLREILDKKGLINFMKST